MIDKFTRAIYPYNDWCDFFLVIALVFFVLVMLDYLDSTLRQIFKAPPTFDENDWKRKDDITND